MKLTIHRALALKKTTKERMEKKMKESVFMELTRGKSGKVKGIPLSEVESTIKGDYASLSGLIANYDKICRAVADSNAKTMVKVRDEEMSVAQLLTRLQTGGWLESMEGMLKGMRENYSNTIKKMERENNAVTVRLDDLLKAVAGGDKKSLSAAEIAQQTEIFHDGNDMKPVDPLGLAEKIKLLEEKVADFKAESDAVLSESNAVTFIEVDLTD